MPPASSLPSATGRSDALRICGALALPAIAIAGFVSVVDLFLPVGSVLGVSANFFDSEFDGEGGFLLFIFLMTVAAAVLALVVSRMWTRVVAGVMGAIAGLSALIDGFGNLIRLSSQSVVSAGPALVVLTFTGLVMVAAAVLVLVTLRRPASGYQAPSNPTGGQA